VCRGLIEAIGDGEEVIDLGGRSVPVRQYAGWFNFKGADQQKTVGVLSGTPPLAHLPCSLTCRIKSTSQVDIGAALTWQRLEVDIW